MNCFQLTKVQLFWMRKSDDCVTVVLSYNDIRLTFDTTFKHSLQRNTLSIFLLKRHQFLWLISMFWYWYWWVVQSRMIHRDFIKMSKITFFKHFVDSNRTRGPNLEDFFKRIVDFWKSVQILKYSISNWNLCISEWVSLYLSYILINDHIQISLYYLEKISV